MKLTILVVFLITLLALPAMAYDWVTNPANGHQYAVIPAGVDWNEAESYAESLGGYLVTINDADENEWIRTHFGQFDFMWIGLYEVDYIQRKWAWISGEPVEYLNWGPGEPSGPGAEHWTAMMGPNFHDGQWADLMDTWPLYYGYTHIALIEIVPEPSGMFILFSCVTTLGILKRRK